MHRARETHGIVATSCCSTAVDAQGVVADHGGRDLGETTHEANEDHHREADDAQGVEGEHGGQGLEVLEVVDDKKDIGDAEDIEDVVDTQGVVRERTLALIHI